MREYLLRKVADNSAYEALVRKLGSNALAAVYLGKGLDTDERITAFSSYSGYLPIDELYDVRRFAEQLSLHREKGSKVVIYGDYDADGAVAASVLWRFFARVLGMNATVYIPDRHEEGYGLNKQALEQLEKDNVSLIITVDCGVRDGKLIEEVTNSKSLEVIVTDHHQPGDTFPTCVTVHPLFPGHESKNRFISGGVVVWKIVRYLEDYFKLTHAFSEEVIDIVGVSLVTDMMPLLGENRVILRNAIRKLRVSPSLGLQSLMNAAQVPMKEVSAYHLGYVLGPRLNASGRIGNQYSSTRLLSTDKAEVARTLSSEVSDINTKRQELTKQILESAIKNMKVIQDKLIVTAGEGWEDGIVGLVAGKLMNKFDLPTITVTIDTEKGVAKGSARSFGELNITELFEQIPEVFSRYGGHHNAAGFTLNSVDISLFEKSLSTLLKEKYSEYMPKMVKHVDSMLLVSELTDSFFDQLQELEPFGQENWEPIFAIAGKVEHFTTFGTLGNHLRLQLHTPEGTIKALIFDRPEMLSSIEQGEEIVIIGRPKREIYQGQRQLSFFVESIVKGRELRQAPISL